MTTSSVKIQILEKKFRIESFHDNGGRAAKPVYVNTLTEAKLRESYVEAHWPGVIAVITYI